jgi:hypothetical protein
MSYYVTMRIGGETSHAALIDLFEKAAGIGILVEQLDEHASNLLDARLTRLRPEDVIELLDPHLNLAFLAPCFHEERFDDLEDACREHGLPYVIQIDGDDEAEGQLYWWAPGMDGVSHAMSDLDHDPVLRVKDVAEALAAGTVAELVAANTVPTVPSFEITS